MTTFYLVRHGEKTREHLMVGRMPGIHLTREGRRQARAMAKHLRRAPIVRILSSPLERAIETAEPLARIRGLEIERSEAFHEIDTGDWTGLPKRRLETLRTWKHFCRYPGGALVPNGETLAHVQERVVTEILKLHATHRSEGIAIFTHEDVIRLAICYFIGAPIDVYDKITIRLGSLSIITVEPTKTILARMDELPVAPKPIRK